MYAWRTREPPGWSDLLFVCSHSWKQPIFFSITFCSSSDEKHQSLTSEYPRNDQRPTLSSCKCLYSSTLSNPFYITSTSASTFISSILPTNSSQTPFPRPRADCSFKSGSWLCATVQSRNYCGVCIGTVEWRCGYGCGGGCGGGRGDTGEASEGGDNCCGVNVGY